MHVYRIPLRHRFRGITHREGILWRGSVGWAEWSPFPDYRGRELVPWRDAAREAAEQGWPTPVRDRVPVNMIIPAADAATAAALVHDSSAPAAKVKVAERGETLADDMARCEAVRATLGPDRGLRVDANGAWSVDQALTAIRELRRFDLEYVEQPCATVEELATLRRQLARRGIDVRIAADESIRRSGDPERVAALSAADIAVLKVQPLGGVRRCLQLAEDLQLPVVVSSAVETSIGLAASVALAACLPELPFACGLGTLALLADDVVAESFVPVDGRLTVRAPEPDPDRLTACAAPPDRADHWRRRWATVEGTP